MPAESASHKVESLPCQEAGELHKEIWATGKPAAVSIKAISHLSGHLPPAHGLIIPGIQASPPLQWRSTLGTSEMVEGKVKDPPSLANCSTVSQEAGNTDTCK